VRGRSWLFACVHAELYATFLAGCPDEADLDALTRAYGVPAAASRSHAVLFDGSRLGSLDERALDVLLRFFHGRAVSFSRRITRVAVAHGGGATGAIVAGFPKVLPLLCPSRVFGDSGAALEWLGCSPAERAELAALADSIASEDALVTRVRAVLGERPGASLAEAARAAGASARSVQRRLREAGTTFQREVDRARSAIAERELAAGESVATVARRAGFSSQQAFSAWFREATGSSPARWRAAR